MPPTQSRVAVVQHSPVFLDLDASVEKACSLIKEAGDNGAQLVLFPECFLPTYPLWVWFIPPGQTHALRGLYSELVENAVEIPGKHIERISAAAKKARCHVAIGANERNSEASGTSLFNTLVLIDDHGKLIGRHRKLIPTAGERLVHASGDGSSLEVYQTALGRLSGLICWEHYMPLAKYTLYALGSQILLAPTWDRGEPWLSTMRHNAKEGRVYVLSSCAAVRRDSIPDRYSFKEEYLPQTEWINPGLSAIVDPDGKFIAEPVENEETVLYAELDPKNFTGPRFQLDVAGHYARPDIFELRVNRRENPLVTLFESEPDTLT